MEFAAMQKVMVGELRSWADKKTGEAKYSVGIAAEWGGSMEVRVPAELSGKVKTFQNRLAMFEGRAELTENSFGQKWAVKLSDLKEVPEKK